MTYLAPVPPIERQAETKAPRCVRCGHPNYSGLALCRSCMDTIQACRAALHTMVHEQLLERVDDKAWLIKPGAREVAAFLWNTIERFEGMPPMPLPAYDPEIQQQSNEPATIIPFPLVDALRAEFV